MFALVEHSQVQVGHKAGARLAWTRLTRAALQVLRDLLAHLVDCIPKLRRYKLNDLLINNLMLLLLYQERIDGFRLLIYGRSYFVLRSHGFFLGLGTRPHSIIVRHDLTDAVVVPLRLGGGLLLLAHVIQPLVLEDLLGSWAIGGLQAEQLGEEVLRCRTQTLFDIFRQVIISATNLIVEFFIGCATVRELTRQDSEQQHTERPNVSGWPAIFGLEHDLGRHV